MYKGLGDGSLTSDLPHYPTCAPRLFLLLSPLAAVANADHAITLRNNCAFGVGMTLSNFPNNGAAYTGPPIPDIAGAKVSPSLYPPGRICDHPPNSGCENNCFGGIAFGQAACSMTEWTFDSSTSAVKPTTISATSKAFSVAQQIIPPSGCSEVTCTSVDCPCNQAYRPNDISGTCGGTGPVDQATRVCASGSYTVVYCP
ncbi:hypothetical protein GGX14DRAFT_702124 [Mycena pura]|uniref:Osmotin thaumatin-like protein n=1 Tax=Mycena pura TaxID=153505 RepID=A0AAD6UK05_9AGAR|nr:hypothetical protein GGX14DRAFT_702124 [Mycena pura]